jgi:ribonucleases P/MRP protein subunit RPP25
MEKALILIEFVKRRVGGLHQINKIDSCEIDDEYEPELEGLPKITQKRRVVCFECNLSNDPLDDSDIGYQEPTEKDHVSVEEIEGSRDVRERKESEDE